MNNVKMSWATDYTTVSNKLVNCFGLHPMTRFLCIYLSCQSNEFTFTNTTMCNALSCSEATLRKYMKEALDCGLIKRDRIVVKGKFGYFSYTLIDPTTLQNLPAGKKTKVEKNQGGKSVRLNKQEVLTNVSTRNKKEVNPAIAALPLNSQKGKSQSNASGHPAESEPMTEQQQAADFIARSTPPRNDFQPFDSADKQKFQGGTEEDYNYIYQAIAEDLKKSEQVWKDVAALAKCIMPKAKFKDELQNWIRFYMNKPHLFHKPVQSLRGGPVSFINWLRKPWVQEKYNPAAKTSKQQEKRTSATRRTIKSVA